MAVLVDGSTSGQAEWIAAALQDSGRGHLVGQRTAGQGAVFELVELPGGVGGVRLNTATLYRSDGKPLAEEADSDARVATRGGPNRVMPEMPGSQTRGLRPEHEAISVKLMAKALELLQGQLGADVSAGAPPAELESAETNSSSNG